MGIFDRVKSKLKAKPVEIKVCMLGARGVGKTSVLTSMFHDLNQVNSNTQLQLSGSVAPGEETSWTAMEIAAKLKELKDMFQTAMPNQPVKGGGIAANFEERTYQFAFGLKNEPARMELQIRDYPGEMIRDDPQKVLSFLEEATAILIAIDTPHLMEERGRFCEAKNAVSILSEFFRKVVSDAAQEKLILFIPLKCEKYYREGRMDEVNAAVQKAYSPLIETLTSGGRFRNVCAITPILTVGDIVFHDFLRNEDGSVKTVNSKGGPLPARAVYWFASTANPFYHSKYCEQPLCYLLSFVTRQYARQKNSTENGFFKKLAIIFKLFPDNPALLLEVNRFASRKVNDKDGFSVISGKEYI